MAGRKRKQREARERVLAAIGSADASAPPVPQSTEKPPERERSSGETVEERVRHIADLMTSAKYNGYVTRSKLAKDWGISESTVRNYAAEAHRLVSFDPEERERMRITLAAQARKTWERASVMRSTHTGLPDFPSVISAIKLEATMIGLDVETRRIELSGKNGGPIQFEDIQKLTDEQLAELAAGAWPAPRGADGSGGDGAQAPPQIGEPDGLRPDAEPASGEADAPGADREGPGEDGDGAG